MFVEDEWFIRFDAAEQLRGAGFEVIEARTADDAMDYISSGERIDALIPSPTFSTPLPSWFLRLCWMPSTNALHVVARGVLHAMGR
ncbi:hypothetical protein [Bradyrhizobium sp. USDA 4506]